MKDFLESVDSSVQRDKPETYRFPDPFGKGIVVEFGGMRVLNFTQFDWVSAGQSEFLWFTRGIPNVQQIFKRIWNTEDLITSYDGFGVFPPHEYVFCILLIVYFV